MKTPEQRLAERDKRLLKSYRWTNKMYDALLVLQGGVCAVCGQSPKKGGMRLVVDHEHIKVISHRTGLSGNNKWQATVKLKSGLSFTAVGKTKVSAEKIVRDDALPFSVRGLLCPGRHGKAGHGCCNRLLGRVDNQVWLRSAADYLDNPPAKKILLDKTPTI